MKSIEIPKPDLEKLYLDEQWTQYQISEKYQCSQVTVRNYMLKYGIPIRPKSKAQLLRNQDPKKHVRGFAGETNKNYRHGLYTQERIYREMIEINNCNRCGSSDNLVVHHKNDDHYDNHPDNLEVLCRSCHMSYHKTKYWEEKRTKD